jgi:hypothetical protein
VFCCVCKQDRKDSSLNKLVMQVSKYIGSIEETQKSLTTRDSGKDNFLLGCNSGQINMDDGVLFTYFPTQLRDLYGDPPVAGMLQKTVGASAWLACNTTTRLTR